MMNNTIKSEMRFIGIDELFVKKSFVSEEYQEMEIDKQEIFKWYFFYQLCLLRNPLKDLMWRFINGENVLNELNEAYIDFCTSREEKRHKSR